MDVVPGTPLMAKPLLQAMLRWLVVTPVMDVVSELGVLVVAQVTADDRLRFEQLVQAIWAS
jgi:hypothetical protein